MTIRSGLSFLAAAVFAASSVFIGCRPSQQARRGSTAAKSSASQTKTMDSLLMVQDKLITVVDTMANIIATDRHRILELEREVAKLKSLLEERAMNGGAVTPPQVTPPNSYNDRTVTGLPMPPPTQSSTLQPDAQQSTSAPVVNDEYTTALKKFNSGNYTDALAAFDDLSHKDANSPLAPNYMYWKGESLYALGEYNEAIRSFHDVLEQYPQSSKADDAEFKIGASYEKLGNTLNAKTAYQRLLLSFPESEYRNRAETRIKKLQ
jgi:tol-pal system protein YbgF